MTKGERARKHILKQALVLIDEKGFFNTSFQDIADRCEMKQTAVIYHYKTKMGLFQALLEDTIARNFDEVERLIKPQSSATDRLWAHMRGHIKWAKNHPAHARLALLMYYEASGSKDFAHLFESSFNAGHERLVHLLQQVLSEDGLKRSAKDIHKAAEVVHDSMMASLISLIILGWSRQREKQTLDKWKNLVSTLIH